jgi:hypothetical protein
MLMIHLPQELYSPKEQRVNICTGGTDPVLVIEFIDREVVCGLARRRELLPWVLSVLLIFSLPLFLKHTTTRRSS